MTTTASAFAQRPPSAPFRAISAFLAWAFLAAHLGAAYVLNESPPESTAARTLVGLLPLLLFVALAVMHVRALQRTDELSRRIELQALAIAFPVSVGLLYATATLERVGYLPAADWRYRYLWAAMVVCYIAARGIVRRFYR